MTPCSLGSPRLFSTLIQVSGLVRHHRTLDVATGTGAAAYAAAEIVETSGYVVGGDISISMLHEAH